MKGIILETKCPFTIIQKYPILIFLLIAHIIDQSSRNYLGTMCNFIRSKITKLILWLIGPNKGSGTFHIIHIANMMARELEIRNLLQLIYEILLNETFVTYFLS